jgi:D-glycero-D-manno-heptose 1,7-bisphosphate phosphatase
MRPEDAAVLPGAFDAMKRFSAMGYALFIVSNQGAFAKGKTPLESLFKTARRVDELIEEAGIRITESYYSFSHPQGTAPFFSGLSLERKPNPYFLKLAEAKFGVSLADSWMIGDRATDVICGKNAGCKTARILEGGVNISDKEPRADITARSLLEAAALIQGRHALRKG